MEENKHTLTMNADVVVRNPTDNGDGTYDVEYKHPQYGWVPFTAAAYDSEPLGREIHQLILNGEAGEVLPKDPPSAEEVASQIRTERDRLLAATDWTQLPDVPEETRLLWAPYRQALRDVPKQSGFPYEIEWPTPP